MKTYINGTKENLGGFSYIGQNSNLHLGHFSVNPGIKDKVLTKGDNLSLGHFDKSIYPGIRVDKALSGPSGYTAEGSPTYGEGRSVTAVDFGEDRSIGAKAGFVYYNGKAADNKKYNTLT